MKGGENFTLPLHPELVEVLQSRLQGRDKVPAAEPVLGVDVSEIKHSFKSAIRRAGLPETTRWHDATRHSFASWLGEFAPFAVVRDCLAHSGGTITDRYSHARWTKQVEAIEALPRLLGEKSETGKAATK